jgi:hypothetical protein
MIDKEIQEKATEWIRSQGWSEENLPNDEYIQMCDAFLAGAKTVQEENERLAKRVCELQADLGRTRDKLDFQNNETTIFKPINELKPLSENDQTLYFVKTISGTVTLATASEILRDMACGCFFTEFALVEDALKLYSSTNYLDTLSLDGDGQCYLKNILEIFLRELINIENQTRESLVQENFVALKVLKQLNNMSYFLCEEAYRKTLQEKKEKK